MCGRAYATFTDEELALRYLNRRPLKIPDLKPNYNMAPTHNVPVLRVVGSERRFDLIRWQLVPPWEPEFKTKLSTINAKSETVFESRLYRGPILNRRCIVPLSGFVEWKREKDRKRPFCIHLRDEPIMSVAGVWDAWRPATRGDEPEQLSFAIMTTSANSLMSGIHDRMPVILGKEDEQAWLDPDNHDRMRIERLLKPCPDEWLDAYEVSTAINSPRNNSADVLKPL